MLRTLTDMLPTEQIRDHARAVLTSQGASFAEVVKVLQEYRDNIGDGPVSTSSDEAGQEGATLGSALEVDAENRRQIIDHLIAYLRGC